MILHSNHDSPSLGTGIFIGGSCLVAFNILSQNLPIFISFIAGIICSTFFWYIFLTWVVAKGYINIVRNASDIILDISQSKNLPSILSVLNNIINPRSTSTNAGTDIKKPFQKSRENCRKSQNPHQSPYQKSQNPHHGLHR